MMEVKGERFSFEMHANYGFLDSKGKLSYVLRRPTTSFYVELNLE